MIICNLAVSLLLLSLSISATTNRSEEQQCVQRIRVLRNTMFRARVMTELKINCAITQHGCHRSPRVSWCKIYENHCKTLNHSDYITTDWKNMTEHEGMAFLVFLKISKEDAGLYRCKEDDSSIGHAINVTVTDKQDEFSPTPSITRSDEQQCVRRVRVPRNTVFRARVMTELKINCTITQHGCHRSPRVSWCKIYESHCKALNHSDYITTEWKNMTEHEGMAFLTFLKISKEDAGLYRCKEGDSSIGHAINVTVTDKQIRSDKADKQDEFSPIPSITSDMNTSPKNDLQWLWPYVYICTGIAGLALVMAITLLYVVRCQGRKLTGKDMASKNQNIKTQKSDQLLPPHLCLNSDLLTSVIYRV